MGTLTLASGQFESGSTFRVDVGPGTNHADKLTLNGSSAIASGALISFNALGTLDQASYTVLDVTSGSLTGTFTLSGGVPNGYLLTYTATQVLLLAGVDSDGVWTSLASGVWSGTNNWSAATVANGSGQTADFNTLDITNDVAVSLDATRVIGSMIFGDTDPGTSANWILDNDGNPANVLTLAGGTPTITVSNSTSRIGVVLAGTEGMTKAGAGALVLTGTNIYSGTTLISEGALQLGDGGATGTLAPGSLITNNAVLVFNRANQIAQGTGFGTIHGTGQVIQNGAGTLVLNAANTYSGGTSNNAGVLSFSNGALGTTGNITMNGGTLRWAGGNTQDISSRLAMVNAAAATFDTGANNVTLATGFGGGTSGSIVKLGSGQLTLSGANTFTGATFINGGTLDVSGQGAAPLSSSSGVTFTGNSTFIYLFASTLPAMTVNSGVTAQVNNAPTGANPGSTMPSLSGAGTFSADNPGGTGQGKGITFGDMSSFTGVLQISLTGAGMFFQMPNLNDTVANNIRFTGVAGTTPQKFIYTGSSPLTLSNRAFEVAVTTAGAQVNIVNNGSGVFTINKTLIVTAPNAKTLSLGGSNTGNNTFAGAITNGKIAVISLTKADAGKWMLSGTNTFTGATTISGGTLEIGGAGVLGGGAYAGNIANGATFQCGSSADQTLSGVISGVGALIKSGAGTLTLAGPNTYNGATTINAGRLRLGADNTLDADNAVVLAGGELDMGGFSNTLGTLAVTGPGTLVLGNGAIRFADSSAVAWTGTLAVTGVLGPQTVRFGTSNSALSPAQLQRITYKGDGVGLNSQGYLYSLRPTGAILIVR